MQTPTSQVTTAPIAGRADSGKGSPPTTASDVDDQAVAVFLAQRPRLVAIASRILRDPGEAEDVVQEAWVRWQRVDRREITNPSGFLSTATRRLAINVLQSARNRHETAATPLLQDVPATGSGPGTTSERADGVEQALHLLLERLSPAERAAYLLREGFDYPYPEVAATLHIGAPNARKLVSRAHARIRSARRRSVGPDAHRRLVHAFMTAAQAGEFTELERLLTADLGRSAA